MMNSNLKKKFQTNGMKQSKRRKVQHFLTEGVFQRGIDSNLHKVTIKVSILC